MPTERGTQRSAAPGVLSGLYHPPKRQQDGIVTERDVTGPYNEMNDLGGSLRRQGPAGERCV